MEDWSPEATPVTSELQPHLQRAVAAHRAGQLAAAESLYRQALEVRPGDADALHLLGVLMGQTGRLEPGIALIRRAVEIDPRAARFHCNLGHLLTSAGRIRDAIDACRTALSLKPDYAEACNNLGTALASAGLFAEAAAACRDAVRLRPDMAAAHNNLGNACRGLGLLDESIDAYRRALDLNPGFADAHLNLGSVLKDTGRVADAVAAYRAALEARPDFAEARHHLVNTVHYDPACDTAALCREARLWYQRHGASLGRPGLVHANEPDPDRRLRIGYVSADFREHPVGLNLLPLFEAHDHRQFQVFCYAGVTRPDALTTRFRGLADAWRDVAALRDEAVSDAVSADQIDILVDLSLHIAGNRLGVFARKPAPVQFTFAGYPGTTGLDTIDCRFTDPFLDPPDADVGGYSEESVRLPDSFWCYEPLTDEPVGPLPATTRGTVTFGCLNNFCKVNDDMLRLWAGVMRTVRNSRLLLLSPRGSHRRHVAGVLGDEGVEAQRVEFVEHRPRADYLRLYHSIDVGLDTLPYNGHTTSLDASWMGVPVVTLVGRTVVGRAGLSLATNLRLEELVAWTAPEFVRIASGLAADLPRLARVRAGLRDRMRRSPLTDGERFARHVEAAYRARWRRWCASTSASRVS
jgi:protein O-GlcNAc transferase